MEASIQPYYSTSMMKPNISSTEARPSRQSLRGSCPKQSFTSFRRDCFGKNPHNDMFRDSVTFPIPAYNQRLMHHILFGFHLLDAIEGKDLFVMDADDKEEMLHYIKEQMELKNQWEQIPD
ncbi:MAG: hypothetical protein L3J17_06855 [Candidatus Jettenia sp.]|nr:MAG: hypothetical protein L3J17_06855 [Candidatus Jettenia sp.]